MPDLVKDLADISKNDVALAPVSESNSALTPPPLCGLELVYMQYMLERVDRESSGMTFYVFIAI